MKVSSPGGTNLDVHAAWTRHTDTPEVHRRHAVDILQTQCGRTVTLSVQNPQRRTRSEETAKKHTHPSKNQGAFSGNLP